MDTTTIMYIVIIILVAIIFFALGSVFSMCYIKNSFVDIFNSTIMHVTKSFTDVSKVNDFYADYDGLENSYIKGVEEDYAGNYHPETAKFLIKLCNNCSVSNYFSGKAAGKENIAPPLPEGFEDYREIASPEGHKVGYMFYDVRNKTAVLIWSSIITASQWISVFNIRPKSFPGEIYEDSSVKFHSGFMKDYVSIRSELLKSLRGARKRGCQKMIIAGNSGGGSMSLISAFDMYMNDLIPEQLKNNMHIYTYGSARCANKNAASYFTTFGLKTNLRIINVEDSVPSLQPVFSNEEFHHVGDLVAFERNLGDLYANHTKAYLENLPTYSQISR